jgi:hypothetical protein
MIRQLAFLTLFVLTVGCASTPLTVGPGPTVDEARVSMRALQKGMTRDEAVAALAFPDFTRLLWNGTLWSASMHETLQLGPQDPPSHTLELYFLFSQDAGEMHLESWQIRKNEWKRVDTDRDRDAPFGAPLPHH